MLPARVGRTRAARRVRGRFRPQAGGSAALPAQCIIWHPPACAPKPPQLGQLPSSGEPRSRRVRASAASARLNQGSISAWYAASHACRRRPFRNGLSFPGSPRRALVGKNRAFPYLRRAAGLRTGSRPCTHVANDRRHPLLGVPSCRRDLSAHKPRFVIPRIHPRPHSRRRRRRWPSRDPSISGRLRGVYALGMEPVLVVDDDADVRDATVAMFENQGYTAVGAEDGRDAMDKLRMRSASAT